MRSSFRSIVAVLLVTAAVVTTTRPGGAEPPNARAAGDPLDQTLFQIHGEVHDPAGHGVAGVTVSDGKRSVLTNAVGGYSLDQKSFGSVTVRASSSFTSTATTVVTQNLPIDVTAPDLTVRYNISTQLDRRYLSPVAGTGSATLTITAPVPNPATASSAETSTCVRVTDTRTGTEAGAQYIGTVNGQPTFLHTVVIDAADPDGRYVLSSTAVACGSGTPVTLASSMDYHVDTAAPTFDADLQMPFHQTNTSPQRIGVRIVDAKIASVTTKLFEDEVFVAQKTAASGTLPSFTLTPGHDYSYELRATDEAGNVSALFRSGDNGIPSFRYSPLSTTAAAVEIDHPCDVSDDIDLATQTRAVTCVDVEVEISGGMASLVDPRHGGTLVGTRTPSFTGAAFVTELPGVGAQTQAAQTSGSTWNPGARPWDVRLGTGSGVQAAQIPSDRFVLGTITGRVPATWASADLRFTGTVSHTISNSCPTAFFAPGVSCTPDAVIWDKHVMYGTTISIDENDNLIVGTPTVTADSGGVPLLPGDYSVSTSAAADTGLNCVADSQESSDVDAGVVVIGPVNQSIVMYDFLTSYNYYIRKRVGAREALKPNSGGQTVSVTETHLCVSGVTTPQGGVPGGPDVLEAKVTLSGTTASLWREDGRWGNPNQSFINNAVWESGSDLGEAQTSMSFEVKDPVAEVLTVKVDDLVTFGPGPGTNTGGRGTPRYYGSTMPYEARLHQSHGYWRRSSGNANTKGAAMQVDWETPDTDGQQIIAIETAFEGRSICFDKWGDPPWDPNCVNTDIDL